LQEKEKHAKRFGLYRNRVAPLDQQKFLLSDLEFAKPENKGVVIRHDSVTRFHEMV
jgi:hypothetical protein